MQLCSSSGATPRPFDPTQAGVTVWTIEETREDKPFAVFVIILLVESFFRFMMMVMISTRFLAFFLEDAVHLPLLRSEPERPFGA